MTTTSLSDPGASAGDDAEISVSLTRTTLPAPTPPIATVTPGSKFVPWIETAVPPAAGPDAGAIEKTICWENSEVLPSVSVAVAETGAPAGMTTPKVPSKSANPLASVTTRNWTKWCSPWRGSRGRKLQEFQ